MQTIAIDYQAGARRVIDENNRIRLTSRLWVRAQLLFRVRVRGSGSATVPGQALAPATVLVPTLGQALAPATVQVPVGQAPAQALEGLFRSLITLVN